MAMTAEQRCRIEALWRQGYSYGKISEEVGVSREAIAGYCYRRHMRGDRRTPALPPAVAKLPRTKKGVPLLQAEWHHCRVIIGTGKDGLAMYCGQPKSYPTSFCAAHRSQLMYRLREPGVGILPRWMRS